MKRSVYSSITHLPRVLAVGMIVLYKRVLSPIKNALLGPGGCCRFYPTCSVYATKSLQQHGLLKGLFFATVRLGKCHPFHSGGYDPVKPVTSRFQTMPKPESLLDLHGKS